MMNSSALTIYPMLMNNGSDPKYLNLQIKLYYKKILAQLRLLNNYNSRIITKNKIVKLQNSNFCYNCSSYNSIIHSLIDCEIYNNFRSKVFENIKKDYIVKDVTDLFNNLNEISA